MTQIIISKLPPLPNSTGSGTCKGTDLTPGTDTTDTTEASTGTTKKYTRSQELNFYLTALGLTTYSAVTGATTTALTVTYANGTLGVGATLTNAGAQAAFTQDGVTYAVGDRVLVKNQSSQAQNGIYTVTSIGSVSTNWVLTRATDYDTAAEVIYLGVVLVNKGTANSGILFQETTVGPFTIGTTDITFSPFSAGSISVPVSLANGGTQASLSASNGGIFYSNASTGALLSGTATATQMLQSGASTSPAWSSSTWPATTITNQILYSSSTNTVAGLTTASNAMVVTSGAGVPSLSRLITPTFVDDTSGNHILGFNAVASAVNYIQSSNNSTGSAPEFSSAGTDSNVDMTLRTKGTGVFKVISNNTTVPIVWSTGTSAQHTTNWSVADTGSSRTITLPDDTGTMAFTGTLVAGNVVKATNAYTVADAGFAIKANTTTAYGGGGTSNAFTATGLGTTSIVTAVILTSTNAVAIAKAVPTANTLTITFTADPGANTTVSWVAITPAV